MALIQAQDFKGAASMLEQVTQREPRNGRAWRNLAVAYQSLKQWDPAIAANQRALEIEPAVPSPLFSLGVIYTLQGNKASSILVAGKAKATRRST